MSKFTTTIATIMLMMLFAVSCTKPDEPNNGGNNGQNDSIIDDSIILNGHDYVDLGLPSGTLWATCNVGATNPEDFGDYFAWGETKPKDVYDWKSYQYGNCTFERFEMTKYCTDSCWGLNGFVDNLTVLEPADDAPAGIAFATLDGARTFDNSYAARLRNMKDTLRIALS